MKKVIVTLSLFVSLSVFLAACSKTNDLTETNDRQQTEAYKTGHSAAESKYALEPIHFNAPFVFPEGMVYDPSTDRFLVSSIAQGTIGAVNREGVYSPFIQDADLASTAGMEIDKAQKRLFVTNSKIEGTLAQLAIYDLNTKARLFLVNLAAVANDGAPHLANDVAIDQQGNAYVTDSYAGIIYKIDRFGNASIFFQNPAFTPAPGGFGFNGIEYSNSMQGYLLVAHSALNQVIQIPINNPGGYTTVQLNTPIISPDGLLLSKNGKELIIVNNTVQFPGSKVMTFETNDGWATGTSTGSFETGIVYPTTLTSDGKTEYVLYSYIHLLIGGQPKETFTIQPLPFASNNPF
jgi:sugar lactone lactonase YvrE